MKPNLIASALMAATFLSACSENASEALAQTNLCKIPQKFDTRSNPQIPIFHSYHQEAVKPKLAKIKKRPKGGKNRQAEGYVLLGFSFLGAASAEEATIWCNYELYDKNKCQKEGVKARRSGQKLSYTGSVKNAVLRETHFSDSNYTIVATKRYGAKNPKTSKKQYTSEEKYERLKDGGVEYTKTDSEGSYRAYKEYMDCSGEFKSYLDTSKGRRNFVRANWTSTLKSDFEIKYTFCKKPGECVSGVL